jgi:hypothetical protein
MTKQVAVERRFNGPPEFVQGGYACGLVAEHIDAPVASVSLRKPVPLATPLAVRMSYEPASLR